MKQIFLGTVVVFGWFIAAGEGMASGFQESMAVPYAQSLSYETTKLMAMADTLRDALVVDGLQDKSIQPDQYLAGFARARDWYDYILANRKADARPYWQLAQVLFMEGEILKEDLDQRLARYERVSKLADACIAATPTVAACHIYKGIGEGRAATARGVVNSLFSAKPVEEAWLESERVAQGKNDPTNQDILTGTHIALTIFYRLIPDSWLVKLLARVRGDLEKSIAHGKAAVALQPYRLEAYKELAVAYLCSYERDDDNVQYLEEGKAILTKIVEGGYDTQNIRVTDAIDKRHARELLAAPDKACGYSRDGYQDTSEEAFEKAKD